MQGRIADNNTANFHGFQLRARSQYTSASHFHVDAKQGGGYFAGGKFESDGSTRVFAHKA